jgi:hypothetical protein
MERLMLFDVVLEQRDAVWLATEDEKLQHFTARLGTAVSREWLPHVPFGEGPSVVRRYFAERLPIAAEGSGGRAGWFRRPGSVTRSRSVDRRRFLLHASAGLAAVTPPARGLSEVQAQAAAAPIERLMRHLHAHRLFTGEVLVAQRGQVLYAAGFGMANRATGRLYTPATPSCLASLSKPITALATLMLAQQNALSIDDPVSKFLPGFSDEVGAATLRHLLTHTSGIPDYDPCAGHRDRFG